LTDRLLTSAFYFRGTGKKGKAAFRQAFGQVRDLRSLLGKKPVLALTATADKSMRNRLCKLLGFQHHVEVLISPNRENIRFSVVEADTNLNCLNWMVELLRTKKEESPFIIIFCHTVSDIVLILTLSSQSLVMMHTSMDQNQLQKGAFLVYITRLLQNLQNYELTAHSLEVEKQELQ